MHEEGPKEYPFLAEPKMQRFLETREIDPEDYPLIERLMTFPTWLFSMDLHNFFTGYAYKENYQEVLKALAEQAKDDQKKEMFATFHAFAEKYDAITCHHLERVLEEIGAKTDPRAK